MDFWSRVERGPDCWLWTGTRTPKGYGRIHEASDRFVLAHRRAWELTNGPIPEGMLICHTCDNPPCVRPDHLFLGTWVTNAQDAYRKGRMKPPTNGRPPHKQGEGVGTSKLTNADVYAIRAAPSQKGLAARYGVDRSVIWEIRAGRIWRHLLDAA